MYISIRGLDLVSLLYFFQIQLKSRCYRLVWIFCLQKLICEYFPSLEIYHKNCFSFQCRKYLTKDYLFVIEAFIQCKTLIYT